MMRDHTGAGEAETKEAEAEEAETKTGDRKTNPREVARDHTLPAPNSPNTERGPTTRRLLSTPPLAQRLTPKETH